MKETDHVQMSVEQHEAVADLRSAAQAFIDAIKALPQSRKSSIAITNAETASMWANKAVSRLTQ